MDWIVYLKSHGNLDKPLDHLSLRQQFCLLLFESVVQISSLTETHYYIELTILAFP